MQPSRSLPRVEGLEPRLACSLAAFPATTEGIYVFSDQLNGGLSDKLVRFLATHDVGTQKELAAENARYLAVNPNWVLLHYRLATTSGPVPYIHNDQWTSDWADVTSHEDWFLHNADGVRLHNSQWDWYLHDIDNPDWRQYWLNSVIADMRATGAQGVFADSFDAGIGGFWFDQYDVRFAGANAGNPAVWPGGVTWLDRLDNLIDYMEAGLAATPEQFLYIPNLDGLVTTWDTMDYSHLDGAFLEGFGESGPGYLYNTPADWVLSMNRGLAMSAADKVLIMQPTLLGAPDSAIGQLHRGFVLGTYLLLQGDHTYLNMLAPGGSPTGAYYYPEYGLDLGPARTPVATDVSQYLWDGVYRRDFQNGIVLVNPTNQTVTVNLGRHYHLVGAHGGGALTDAQVDAQGNYTGGSLSLTRVDQVTLVPGSAAILLTKRGTLALESGGPAATLFAGLSEPGRVGPVTEPAGGASAASRTGDSALGFVWKENVLPDRAPAGKGSPEAPIRSARGQDLMAFFGALDGVPFFGPGITPELNV